MWVKVCQLDVFQKVFDEGYQSFQGNNHVFPADLKETEERQQ